MDEGVWQLYILLSVTDMKTQKKEVSFRHGGNWKYAVNKAVDMLRREMSYHGMAMISYDISDRWYKIEDIPQAWDCLSAEAEILAPLLNSLPPTHWFALVSSGPHYALCVHSSPESSLERVAFDMESYF